MAQDTSDRRVDVAIIGAGTAGLSAYSEVRKATDSFVLINGGPYGTTCARVGCMPSKVLIQVAHDFQRRHVFATEGIEGGAGLRINIPHVLEYVRSLRDSFVGGVLKTVKSLGDHSLQGYARFREPTVLDVEGQIVRAKRVIIATGSSPVIPDDWQPFADRILTTDTLFEQATLPASLAVIGLGVIGIEMGQALARLGITISGFSRSDRLAGLTDPEVNSHMRALLEEELPIYTGKAATVYSQEKQLLVNGEGASVTTDMVLASLGRRPNLAELGLQKIGVPLNARGLPAYDPTTMQVGNLPIFLAGDGNADQPVLHEAADEGRIAGFNSVQGIQDQQDQPHCFKRRTPLHIVFSDPTVAIVGSSFAELQQQNMQNIAVGTVRFAKQGRARVMAENRGILHVYGNKATGQLLGAELAAPRGEHLAHLLAWAIQKEMSVFEMLQLPFYHPVIEEGLRTALRDVSKQVQAPCPTFELTMCNSTAVGEMG